MEQKQIREIARAEYFSGANEPTKTIKKHTVRFSAYCLNSCQVSIMFNSLCIPQRKGSS